MNTKGRTAIMQRTISGNMVTGTLALLLTLAGAAGAQAVELKDALSQVGRGRSSGGHGA